MTRTHIKPNGKRKRAPKGQGRLYKRGPGGKEYPADSPANLPFWIAYSIPNPDGGTGQRIREPLRDENGKQITDRKKAEAERLRILAPYTAKDKVESLRQIQAKLQDAEHRLVEAERDAAPTITIAAAWEVYLGAPNRPDTGEATLDQYALQWNRFVRWMATEYPDLKLLREVTQDVAGRYAAHLQKAGISAGTFNKHVRLLELVFRVLGPQAGVTSNHWVTITRKKQQQHSRRELTSEELRRVCGSAIGELRLLLALGIYTGMRRGDCCLLRWTEVDLARGFISRVPNKTARSSGKAVKIPLFRDLAEMLQKARQDAKGEYVLPEIANLYMNRRDTLTARIQQHLWNCGIKCHKAGTGNQIECDHDGNPVRTEHGNVKTTYTGKRANVDVGFHSLRHSFVSLCREAGAPLSVVESIVGHSNPAMTRHYTHTSEIEAARAIAALPSIASDNPVPRPMREPLPSWARELVEKLTPKNIKTIKAELLKG